VLFYPPLFCVILCLCQKETFLTYLIKSFLVHAVRTLKVLTLFCVVYYLVVISIAVVLMVSLFIPIVLQIILAVFITPGLMLLFLAMLLFQALNDCLQRFAERAGEPAERNSSPRVSLLPCLLVTRIPASERLFMQKKLYSVFDKKANTFGSPTPAASTAEMMRAFVSHLANPKMATSPMVQFPGDYALYLCGTFYEGDGTIDPLVPPQHVEEFTNLSLQAKELNRVQEN